jgi:hypothetical protein
MSYSFAPSRRLAAAVMVSLLLGGCALSNPYVKVPTVDGSCSGSCTIDQAQSYSRAVRDRYLDRLGTHAKVRANAGAAQILFGSAALGFGAAEAHRDAFVGTALAGATTFGLSTWFGNPTLENVYGSGILALVCAEVAVEPLRLSGDDSADLQKGLDELDSASGVLTTDLQTLESLIGTAESIAGGLGVANRKLRNPRTDIDDLAAQLRLAATAALPSRDSATDTLAKTDGTRRTGIRLRHANAVAGYQLARTVERIVATINEEARKAQPDPAAAFKIVADLGALAGKIVPGVDLTSLMRTHTQAVFELESKNVLTLDVPETQARRVLQQLLDTTASVNAAARRLAAAIERIEAVVALVASTEITGALQACGLQNIAGFTVAPSTLAWKKGVGSATVRVAGGNPPYSGTVIGSWPTGLAVRNPTTGDRTFEITTTADVPAGDYLIVISDATSKEVGLPLKITETTATQPAAAAAAAGAAAAAVTDVQIDAALGSLNGLLKDKPLDGRNNKVTNIEIRRDTKVFALTIEPAETDVAQKAAIAAAAEAMVLPSGKTAKQIAAEVGFTLSVL